MAFFLILEYVQKCFFFKLGFMGLARQLEIFFFLPIA